MHSTLTLSRSQARRVSDQYTLLSLMIFVLLSFGGLGRAMAAGDEGVYGAAAPEGSAFVRVFNATTAALPGGKVADQNVDEVAPNTASEFVFLPPGTHTLSSGGASESLSLKPSRYYTVARTAAGFTVLDNGRHENRLKALVLLYNFTDVASLGLRTPDGKATVVDAVPPGRYGSREVNAVKASLAAYDGDRKLADAKPVGMERGRAYSLFVTGTATAPVLSWVVN